MALPTRVTRALVDPFETVSRDLETLAERVFGRDGVTVARAFPVDIVESSDTLHVYADLPGFAREQIDVTLDNNVLTVTADRGPEPTESAGDYLLRERRWARYQRSFTLPNTIDDNSIKATLDAGVLHLTLDKRQEAKPRKIVIA